MTDRDTRLRAYDAANRPDRLTRIAAGEITGAPGGDVTPPRTLGEALAWLRWATEQVERLAR